MEQLKQIAAQARQLLDDPDTTDRSAKIETALYDLLREVEKHLKLLSPDERFFSQGAL